MASATDPIRRLVLAFSRLPGIGEKTATRLTFFVLNGPPEVARELSAALADVRERVRFCSVCCNLTEADPCRFCADPRRDDRLVCVVESVPSLLAIERTGEFRGRYHVLHGVISPLDGVGPEQLRLKELVARVALGVDEVIVATNPSVEGEATALYIQRLMRPLGVRMTRIASGVSVGSDLEYADQATLGRALSARREM
ncbi:recombination mediator RecR [Myxococcota bacterium]|jgi:recombination protein RecR|nr:recombination mediator RecR [Myxococcota bacterium]